MIDRGYGANGAVFLVAMSKDAQGAYHQRLHALDLTTGAELGGSPSEIEASYPGNGYGSSDGIAGIRSGAICGAGGPVVNEWSDLHGVDVALRSGSLYRLADGLQGKHAAADRRAQPDTEWAIVAALC